MAAVQLSEYLEAVTKHRLDCCELMADWLVANGWPDPMADRRGTYSMKLEYRRMLKGEGGLLASCVRRFAMIGLRETEEPKAGDLAVVLTPVAIRGSRIINAPVGAICVSTNLRAVVARDVALVIAPAVTIRAWSL